MFRRPWFVMLAACGSCVNPARLPPLDDQVRLPSHVDRMAAPIAGRGLPRYPSILWSASVDGDVRVRYVVDAAGHTVPASFEIDTSAALTGVAATAHQLFKASVRQAFLNWLFVPAQLQGRRVAVRYEEVFSFRAPRGLEGGVANGTASIDPSFGAIPRTFIPFKLKDFTVRVRFSTTELLAAQRRTLAKLAETAAPRGVSGAPAAMLCVTMRHDTTAVPADAETIRGLNNLGYHAVAARDCQGTHVNLTVAKAEGWARDQLRVWATISRGESGEHLVCVVIRDQREWSTTCRSTSIYSIQH